MFARDVVGVTGTLVALIVASTAVYIQLKNPKHFFWIHLCGKGDGDGQYLSSDEQFH